MIDTDKYKGHLVDDFQVWVWSSKMLKVANYEEQMATASLLKDTSLLLAEVERLREEVEQMRVLKIVKENERLREENQTLRKMDWEYECLWDWLAENTNLLNTIEPLMEEWKKEMIE